MSLGSWMSSLFATTSTDSSAQAPPHTSSPSSSPSSSSSSSTHTAVPSISSSAAGPGYAPPLADGVDLETSRRSTRAARAEDGLRLDDEDEHGHGARKPYVNCMIAGGIGGTIGDMIMHSLDTVKTRQQGDPHMPPKYASMSSSYATIFREEGFRRGLYGGVTPALFGSFPGTVIFFGTYEWSKRHMLDAGINPSIAYLTGGFVADLAASFVYVPSEVLKTRLQLQGRFNNPFFKSGYNYRSTLDALRTIVRTEGIGALYYGFKATLYRDLPFSALQFAFYEQERKMAQDWVGCNDIGLPLEILTATTAGGMAGVITCPLDVVKTRIQTQQNPDAKPQSSSSSKSTELHKEPSSKRPHPTTSSTHSTHAQSRLISTSSPSTSTVKPGASVLDTSSVFTGLRLLYRTEGVLGWFRGVGPRGVWTSVQTGTMLVLYQYLLKKLDAHQAEEELRDTPL